VEKNYTATYYLDKGKERFQQEKYYEAMKYFEKAVQKDSSNKYIFYYQGIIYEKAYNYVAAFNCFNIAIKIDSNFYEAMKAKNDLLYKVNEK
jgi:tetratricopeptide (TPR) repeat protein